MTPEQIAAEAIAAAVAPHLCVAAGFLGCPDAGGCRGCLHDAQRASRAAVEAISARALVIVTAQRATEMLAAHDAASQRAAAARRAGIEAAAAFVDCSCPGRAAVLAALGHNSADRWRACGDPNCCALLAAGIRAMAMETEGKPDADS